MAAVSVSELNQQTAKVLDRVKGGESLDVTEHGRPIARLLPIHASTSLLERLVSEGRAVAATSARALFERVPSVPSQGPSLSEALQNARDAERS